MFGPQVYDGKEVGVLDREISVPESEDGEAHEVLDLGTLEVPEVKVNGNAQANR
jgi:hypothetical protein